MKIFRIKIELFRKRIMISKNIKIKIKLITITFFLLLKIQIPNKKISNYFLEIPNFNASRLNPFITNSFNNTKIIKYKGRNQTISEITKFYAYYLPDKFKGQVIKELNTLNYLLSLDELPEDQKEISKIKPKILKQISNRARKKLTNLDTVFIPEIGGYGNTLLELNNIIFYCEILGCKEIILNKNNRRHHWHFNNTVFSNKTNLTIRVGDNVNCFSNNTVCHLSRIYFSPIIIKTKIRTDVIKNEIINNLPKIKAEPNDLYMHIRSGNIFGHHFIHSFYAQPPLCFYEKIINNFKFNKIYIIAQNNANIIINKLTNKYHNVIFKKNSIDKDIASLVYAFNIVGSISSFFLMTIKLNDNLKNVWEYDLYRLKEKFFHLHYHFFKFPKKFNIYTMMPSEKYRREMFNWKKRESQIKLMLEEDCPNNFIITKQN